MMKRGIGWVLVLMIALLSAWDALAVARTEIYWRGLTLGDKGYDVMVVKRRLQELNYYKSKDLSDEYNARLVPAVKKFQACNDLEPTGALRYEEIVLLHSPEALPDRELENRDDLKDATVPEPAPPPEPPREMPELDEDGFLKAPGSYYKEDEEAGEWVYVSEKLQIFIHRRVDEKIPLIWFETHIYCREDEGFVAVENNPDKPGRAFRYPADIAKTYRLVLGFTDDFYGHRVYRKERLGTVIRNGKVLGDKTYNKDMVYLPNLDILAVFEDGSMKAMRCTEYENAQALLDMGVVSTFCFGPVLVQDGVIDQRVLDKRFETKSPRQALGMVEKGHFFLLTVQGRIKESAGVGLIWMAEKMKEHGAVEALNLDGGNTVALVFRGKMLNRLATWKNESFVRSVSSLMGIGYLE